ncbi:hypothetical protein Leryth_009112 [Lithospermum erythrorhizon]|nr:hypothetical protein Leryth_009112 [Lithospermum erythrorhizon]
MDKNKSKSNLLAAGRKKLQQFRQKKDNKGSKSSTKLGKTVRNEETSSPKRASTSHTGPKGKQLTRDAVTPSESHSQGKASADGKNVVDTVVDRPPKSVSAETTAQKSHSQGEASADGRNVVDTVVDQLPESASAETTAEKSQSQGEALADGNNVVDTVIDQPPKSASAETTAEKSHSQGEASANGSNVVDNVVDQPPETARAETTSEKATEFSVEDSTIREAKLNTDVSHESPVQYPPIQEGDHFVVEEVTKSSDVEVPGGAESKDQFTDSSVDSQFQIHGQYSDPQVYALSAVIISSYLFMVGAMQNAEGLGLLQVDKTVDMVNGEDGKLPSSESDAPLIVSSESMADQNEVSMNKPSIDNPEDTSTSADYAHGGTEEMQLETAGKVVDTEGFPVFRSYTFKEVLQSEINKSPARQDVVYMSIPLSKQVNYPKESFKKKPIQGVLGPLCNPFKEPLLERLKEELYLTTFVKDAAHLELSEQIGTHSELFQQCQQFSNKLSSATTSLDEIYVKNENLAEENSLYKYQLKESESMREGLLEELNGSKAEVEKSSARVNQLLKEFETSQGDLSKLSSELVECRNSLVAFQTENETLRQNLNLETEEKEQLVMQKTNMKLENEKLASELTKCKDLLISLQSENANMTEHVAQAGGVNSNITSENELLLCQNNKLVTELGECKNMLLRLQLENENLNAAVLEERKKIDHEKDYLFNESEEIVIESIKCMVLVESMQMEIFSNKSILVSVIAERSRLEEERMYFSTQNEKLSRELVNYKAIIEKLQAELHAKLKEHIGCEEENIELIILLEALRQHVHEANVKGSELVGLYEASQEKIVDLRAENSTITSKIGDFEAKLSELQNQLNGTYQRSSEMHDSNSVELSDFHGQIDYLSLSFQHENEIFVLKASLKNSKDFVVAIQSELLGKICELEQSEQRVSSLREKLSIAVTKGKGLVVQRDKLKQSLAETSTGLEKCKQDLLAKESRFNELENKLKAYMEAGERMEALESELSYIRNSATALRESFLLKDSALQRIEEILEDLDLPEHFRSGDIIEKVDWLAKYVSGNSLTLTDRDQKTSVAGGAYSDAGMVDAEGLQEEMSPNTNTSEYYRETYEDLQNRFYGLQEQNEMLEQSLMERNNLVQQWEKILDRIGLPSHLRSMEPQNRIEWLGSTLSEAQNYFNSLQEKIYILETSSALVTTDLERSVQRTSELENTLQSLITEKEALSHNLEILTQDFDEMSKKEPEHKVDNESLQREVVSLQERLDQKHGSEERSQYFEREIRRLQDVLIGVLQDSGLEDTAHGCAGFDYFEGLLMKLLEKHAELSRVVLDKRDPEQVTENPRDPDEQFKVLEDSKAEIIVLNTKLDDTSSELLSVKEERNGYLEKNQSLVHEVEALETKMINLQDQLSQEEQKSSTLREKLNVAVRKGKSLMQQRDSMKLVVEETNSEIGHLKSVISEYENKTKDLNALQENLETLRSENMSLRDLISQNDPDVQGKDHTLSLILEALGHIDVGLETGAIVDPAEKLEKIGKRCQDLLSDMANMEQESSKSKRAAELLAAELNEVQERNDVLQEELGKASADLSTVSREREYYNAEAMQVRSNMDQLDKDLSSFSELLENTLSNDLKTLRDLKVCIKSCHELGDTPSLLSELSGSIPGDLMSSKSRDKALMQGIGSLKGQLYKHLELVHEERSGLANVIGLVYSELNSQKESCESMRRDIQHLESVEIEKDSKLHFARRNFSFLLDACTTIIAEIDNFRKELVERGFASYDSKVNISPKTSEFTEEILLSSTDEGVRAIQEQLVFAVNDLMSVQAQTSEINVKDARSTILNLQKELQEKDIQGERNCMQLVQQIKEAEANAKKYSQQLQLSQGQVEDLQREVGVMEEECNVLEKKTKDLQDKEAACMESKERIQSLTDELAAKGQGTYARYTRGRPLYCHAKV